MDVLITFESDWSDEFTVYGFCIMPKDQWLNFQEKLHEYFKYDNYLDWYFGTNEHIEWSGYSEVIECLRERDLTPTESLILKTTLCNGARTYGHFPGFEQVYDHNNKEAYPGDPVDPDEEVFQEIENPNV